MLEEFESLCVYIFPKCWTDLPRTQSAGYVGNIHIKKYWAQFIQITYYVAWNNYKESERDCCPALCPVVICQDLYFFPFIFERQGGQQGPQEGQEGEHLPKAPHPCYNCSFQSE